MLHWQGLCQLPNERMKGNKNMKYDLVITIVNRGFSDEVMTAAKSAGAFGGTVVNARGTGTNELQEFFGSIIQPEKELIMILTERDKRNAMMEAICRDAGLAKEGMGICFSLPVDGVSGIRLFDEKEQAKKEQGKDEPKKVEDTAK